MTTSSQTILQESLVFLGEDTKFIRLATLTTFVHSISFLAIILFNIYNVLQNNLGGDSRFTSLLERYFTLILPHLPPTYLLLVLIIIIFIGYVVLPPIGEGAMISYLHEHTNKGTISFTQGLQKFFPMLEFNASITLFSVFTFLTTLSRLRILGILHQPLIIFILCIWLFIILMVSFLLSYSRYFIVTQDIGFYDAMKKSMTLSIHHIMITIKYVAITYFLYVRLLINIVLFVGIPLGVIYIVNLLGLDQVAFINTGILIVILGLLFVVAYINGIVEAFFTTYWYKVFQRVQNGVTLE